MLENDDGEVEITGTHRSETWRQFGTRWVSTDRFKSRRNDLSARGSNRHNDRPLAMIDLEYGDELG